MNRPLNITTLFRLRSAVVAGIAVAAFAIGGCVSTTPIAAKPMDPAQIAKLEQQKRQADQMQSQSQRHRDAESIARRNASDLRAQADELRRQAMFDESRAEVLRHDANVLAGDGRTIVRAGEGFSEMFDNHRGPRTVKRGQAKLAQANAFGEQAAALVERAEAQRTTAAELLRDADAQLTKAKFHRTERVRLNTALASMPMNVIE